MISRLREISHLDFSHSALIVVDMQNDFLARDGYYDRKDRCQPGQMASALREPSPKPVGPFSLRAGFPEGLVPCVCNVIDSARRKGSRLVYVRAVYDQRFDTKPPILRDPDRQHYPCKLGTWGAELIDPIQELRLSDVIIEKHTFDAFLNTNLSQILREWAVRTVLIGGVETHACVLTTAQSASLNGFDTIVLEDCIASSS